MKRISIFLLSFISLNSIAQVDEIENNDLKKIFLTLPESVFSNRDHILSHARRESFWALYEKGKFEKKEVFKHGLLGKTNLEFYDDSLNIECLIDEGKGLIRVMNNYCDVTPTYVIKVFNCTPKVIGMTLKYSDHASLGTTKILFYEKKENGFKNITNQTLKSFNYFTDNYNEITIDSLNFFYKENLRMSPIHDQLLYGFTESDTVIITYDCYDYYYMREKYPPGIDIHSTYFHGHFYTKKYIMDNGKLRLAE